MKAIKSTNKSRQIDRDFAEVCKKHNLQRVAIAIEVPVPNSKDLYTIMSSCHISGKKGGVEERKFANSVAHLFNQFGFKSENIEMATSILKMHLERYKPSKEEIALSESDKKKLLSIRNKKIKLINEKKYEEASKLRDEERKLLGVYAEPEVSHKLGAAFDISLSPEIADVATVGKMIFDSIKKDSKNWKTEDKK